MPTAGRFRRQAGPRDFLYFLTPRLWPQHPFLPVARWPRGQEGPDLGLLYDARGISGLFGYSATVFLVNLWEVPATEAAFLKLPRLVYDGAREMADDGWVVD